MGFSKFSSVCIVWLIGKLVLVSEVHCGLQPYYINFPPPAHLSNGIDSDFPHLSPTWPQNPVSNLTRDGNLPSGPIPLIVHTWVKPDTSEGTKLQNGTVVYYVAGPWGGIRSAPAVSPTPPEQILGTMSNSISDSGYPTISSGVGANNLHTNPENNSGWQPPNIDITTPLPPLPNREQGQPPENGPWGHGHFGFGWPSATQLYEQLSETTTNPTRSLTTESIHTTTSLTTATEVSTTIKTPTTDETTTADPIAANTNSRFPVSDSVRKFRRIVAQIRAITKKELQTRNGKTS